MANLIGKKDFISKLKNKSSYGDKEATMYYEKLIQLIGNFVKEGKKVSIGEIGMFWKAEQKERKNINPRTGEMITIKKKNVLKFRPSKNIKEKVEKR